MIGFIKLAALSAAFSYSTAAAYHLPVQKLEAAVSAKYQDRILPDGERALVTTSLAAPGQSATSASKGDRLVPRSERAARLVTIERREGESTSVLVRMPQASMAQR